MKKNRKYWGWGYQDMNIAKETVEQYKKNLMALFQLESTDLEVVRPLAIESLALRPSRFDIPSELASICDNSAFERASHSYGKSYRDIWRGLHGLFDNPPDYIAYPHSEEDIAALMTFAVDNKVALIPFGGGSSVTGGVEPTLDSSYQGVITVDMERFDKIVQIDKASRSANIQAGIFGPALETGLRPHGLTMRHYPQSFEFSTLGGWIATRSGGHFATLFTHIDEFVQSVRMVTPEGTMDSRRLPGHGAGPQEERLIAGSEGIFGIITSAWMRLQEIPIHKETKTVRFSDFWQAVEATRRLAQSGLFPTNARLVDPIEAFSNGLGDGQSTIVIIGFESHQHSVKSSMDEALAICQTLGGQWQKDTGSQGRSEKADAWKDSFLKAPYLRDELMKDGFILETFETAVTWDQFETFHNQVKKATEDAVREHADMGTVTVRFTHLYPDGPAPYYTVIAKGKNGQQLDQWDAIKRKASEAIIANGGTITHHHAVGKDHAPYYKLQRSDIFGQALGAVKESLDPNGIMNPEVLIN